MEPTVPHPLAPPKSRVLSPSRWVANAQLGAGKRNRRWVNRADSVEAGRPNRGLAFASLGCRNEAPPVVWLTTEIYFLKAPGGWWSDRSPQGPLEVGGVSPGLSPGKAESRGQSLPEVTGQQPRGRPPDSGLAPQADLKHLRSALLGPGMHR